MFSNKTDHNFSLSSKPITDFSSLKYTQKKLKSSRTSFFQLFLMSPQNLCITVISNISLMKLDYIFLLPGHIETHGNL